MKCPACRRPLPRPKFKCGVWVKPYYSDKPRPCSKTVAREGQNCKVHRIRK